MNLYQCHRSKQGVNGSYQTNRIRMSLNRVWISFGSVKWAQAEFEESLNNITSHERIWSLNEFWRNLIRLKISWVDMGECAMKCNSPSDKIKPAPLPNRDIIINKTYSNRFLISWMKVCCLLHIKMLAYPSLRRNTEKESCSSDHHNDTII